jgi:hypothetical protein
LSHEAYVVCFSQRRKLGVSGMGRSPVTTAESKTWKICSVWSLPCLWFSLLPACFSRVFSYSGISCFTGSGKEGDRDVLVHEVARFRVEVTGHREG